MLLIIIIGIIIFVLIMSNIEYFKTEIKRIDHIPEFKSYDDNLIFKPEKDIIYNTIDYGKDFNDINIKKIDIPANNKQNEDIQLYHDVDFYFKPTKKILDDDPYIDQTVNTNIMNYVNNGYTSYYDEDKNTHNFNKIEVNNKTIGKIYDDITNDGRKQYQNNLDNLDMNSEKEYYEIDKHYGATRFETYCVK